jgi:hypothetical protein
MEWHIFTNVSLEILPMLWHQLPSYSKKLKCLSGLLIVKLLGNIKNIYIQAPVLISPN